MFSCTGVMLTLRRAVTACVRCSVVRLTLPVVAPAALPVAAVPDAEPEGAGADPEVAGAEPEAVPEAEPLGAVVPDEVPARGALEPDVAAAPPVPLPLVVAPPLPVAEPLAGGGICVVPPLDEVAWAVTAASASAPAATVAKSASLML
jgi:hypothetical protein